LFFAAPLALKMLAETNTENQMAIAASLRAFDVQIMGGARKGAFERFITYAEMAPFGTGLSRIGPAVYRYSDLIQRNEFFKGVIFFADNLWVQVVVDLGLPGVFVFTLLALVALYESFRAVRWAPNLDAYLLSSAVLCALIAIFCGGYGAEPLLYEPEGGYFWFFTGALYRLANQEKFTQGERRG
jgi:O-antigen ligase